MVRAVALTLLVFALEPLGFDRPPLVPSFVVTADAAEPAKSPGVGDVAPDVQLGDQHGNAFALGDALKAREFVVIAFYPKAFTGG